MRTPGSNWVPLEDGARLDQGGWSMNAMWSKLPVAGNSRPTRSLQQLLYPIFCQASVEHHERGDKPVARNDDPLLTRPGLSHGIAFPLEQTLRQEKRHLWH